MLLFPIFGTGPTRFTRRIENFPRFEMAATSLIALVPARRHAAKKARSLDVAIR